MFAVRQPNVARRFAVAAALGLGSLLAAFAVLAPGATAGGDARLTAANPFVTRSGTQLMLAGRPWVFTGYDAYQLPSLQLGTGYQCGGQYSIAWLDQLLDEIRGSSGSVAIRTWFFQSYSGDDYVQFDAVLAAAAARGIKIIPVLANQWGTCEGANDQSPYKGLSWYQSGYKQPGDGYALSYRDYAIAMARRYADNPTIGFWQLMNETEASGSYTAGTCNEAAAAAAIRSFADDVTGAIKAVDPNHLVNLGTMGGGQCGTQGNDFSYVNGGSTDICEYHDYWPAVLGGSQWDGVAVDVNRCHGLGKPIFAGEVGLLAGVQPDWSVSSTVSAATLQQRATFIGEKADAAFNLGIAGFLVWNKTSTPSTSYDVGPGDPVESVMSALQQRLSLGAGELPGGQYITDGDPGASGGSGSGGTAGAPASRSNGHSAAASSVTPGARAVTLAMQRATAVTSAANASVTGATVGWLRARLR